LEGERERRTSNFAVAAVITVALLLLATLLLTSGSNVNQPSPSLADCPTKVPTPWFGLLETGTSSATICFQIYEFDSASAVTLNTDKLLQIVGYPVPLGGSVFSGAANFTVSPSVAQVNLGGPTEINEGMLVAYTISAKPGASGTYFVDLQGYLLGGEGPGELCTGGAGELVAGNGHPNYALPGSCMQEVPTSTDTYAIPGVAYNVPANELYYRIYGAGNATQQGKAE